MSFGEALKKAFDHMGGVNPTNLGRVVDAARVIRPDISSTYIMRLWRGHTPSLQDRKALFSAFRTIAPGGVYGNLASDDSQIARAIDFGSKHLKSHDLVDEFVDHYSNMSFRNESDEGGDLPRVLNEFRRVQQLEDEAHLFGLGGHND